uniref:Odorant receptor n=1 Tax=Lobesia botrana TaxID=209534 RepID=A0A345BEZ0_9NEOP|nr:odorant receptors OR78 [Lobesia botrana]
MSSKQSDSFNQNRLVWTIFGLWPGKMPYKYYKYFSYSYLIITLLAYNTLLNLNLYYTPRKIDLLVKEIIFSFTEIAVMSKVFMVVFKRKKLVAIFDLLDCEEFKGTDDAGREIVERHNKYYKMYLLSNTTLSNFTYLSQVLFPVIGFLIFNNDLDLPICKYYFLSDETKNYYFAWIFVYQSFGMYGHMMYNVNIDTLIAGFMILAVGQVRLLHHELENLKTEKSDTGSEETLEYRQRHKFRKIVNHYALFLQYCKDFQEIISGTMFVQYGIGAGIICVIMVGLLLPSTVETFMFMVGYFMAMNLQILVPAWLGTQLSYESQELMVAAYTSEWLPRSEWYKKNFKLFVERAKHPVVITGLKIFPLSLATYISIMKTAYSCFTLLRIIQDRQEQAMH